MVNDLLLALRVLIDHDCLTFFNLNLEETWLSEKFQVFHKVEVDFISTWRQYHFLNDFLVRKSNGSYHPLHTWNNEILPYGIADLSLKSDIDNIVIQIVSNNEVLYETPVDQIVNLISIQIITLKAYIL